MPPGRSLPCGVLRGARDGGMSRRVRVERTRAGVGPGPAAGNLGALISSFVKCAPVLSLLCWPVREMMKRRNGSQCLASFSECLLSPHWVPGRCGLSREKPVSGWPCCSPRPLGGGPSAGLSSGPRTGPGSAAGCSVTWTTSPASSSAVSSSIRRGGGARCLPLMVPLWIVKPQLF